jgi:hypothetical protein
MPEKGLYVEVQILSPAEGAWVEKPTVHLTAADRLPRCEPDDGDHLISKLIEEFRKVPDQWKPDAIKQVKWISYLTKWPPCRLIGAEKEVAKTD